MTAARSSEVRADQPPPSPALPASFAGGRYEVKSFLGEGGRKRVFLARDTRLDREVAVAQIKTEGLDADGLARVQREAQSMARLGDHPNIVTVFDIGEESGQPYIVSQYMAGGELGDLLDKAEGRRLGVAEALRISNDVRLALEHAHSQGVIHRDIKPANIWLAEDGTSKLGDFGLAVALDRSRLTIEGTMVGTVAYMPPEQALGKQPDARSDLYSLGCVLYEMLTGRPPFLGDDSVSIISQHINTAPVAPTWHNPEVPKALEALIMRCLAKNPEERPESAAAIPAVLEAITASAGRVSERVSEETPVNPLDRLAGGVFVGREAEMDELRAGLENALSGHGQLLMLVGEPGIGKTRTSEELATYAGLRNARVLWGKCYEGEGAPAYWPWVQLIRSYVFDRDPKELMSDMGPGAADIGDVVSEVKERLPGLPSPPELEPEQARFRLFDSITTFLKNVSQRQPHVLILDDLHWADKPSLLLLQFMARELRGSRLLVLGTYRDVELRRAHPLSQTLGELSREGLSQRILLRGLTAHDVKRFVEVTAGVTPPKELVEAVYRETEGNPFFVNEVVRLLVADGRLEKPETVTSWSVTIPQGVREVVGRRLDHLSEECNRVLTMGAVIGREFWLRTLADVADVPEDELLETLEEAVAARVITEVPNQVDQYTFTHALIKETLYEELSTARRVRAHRQIGEVLEAQHKDDVDSYLPQLAYHFSEAAQGGDVDKAIDYAVRAAKRANQMLAYEEAAVHYDRALQVLELADAVDERRQCEVLIELATAYLRGGDSEQAEPRFLQAAEIARKVGGADLFAEAVIGYGEVWWGVANVNQTLVDLLSEALELLPNVDSSLRSKLLARKAWSLLFSPDRERIPEISKEAVEMARRLGDPTALAYALTAQYTATYGHSRKDDRLGMATEMIDLAAKAGDKREEFFGHHFRLATTLSMGDMKAVHSEIERCAELAEELRQPLFQWQVSQYRVMLLLLEGRLAEAEAMAIQSFQIGVRAAELNARQMIGVQTYAIAYERGQTGGFEEGMRALIEQYPQVPSWRAALSLAFIMDDRIDEAEAEFEILAANDFTDVPDDINRPIALAIIGVVCGHLDDKRRAEVLYPILEEYGDHIIVIGAASDTYGPMSRITGVVATALERWDDAERHFESALAVCEKIGSKRWKARTQLEYAGMLAKRARDADRKTALELLSEAIDLTQEMGAKGILDLCLALKLELQGVPAPNAGTSIDAVASLVYAEKPDLRPQAAPDGTVTLLFSDIEGSTALADRLGDKSFMEVLREHNAIIREQLQAHSGYEVKSEGDGFMVAFQSATKAVDCASAIQKAMTERNESAEEPIKVRIGLHAGEVIKEDEDFFGRNVIMAARIASQANGGEVLASGVLKALLSGSEAKWGEARTVELKGLSGEHEIWALKWD
jgi:class 3 adenylate cyclase